MSGTLYTYPNCFRADKIRAVAAVSGFDLKIAADYVHGVTNETSEYRAKFFGKAPAFESGSTALCDDTAICHFVGNAQTRGGDNVHDVLCWAGCAEQNILPAIAAWVWPTLGICTPNKQQVEGAKKTLKAILGQLNDMLSTCTWLVGERLTYADITMALTLKSAYERVFTPDFRKDFPNVNRWFMTTINQPSVKSVIGEVSLCEKEAQFDKEKFSQISGKGDNKKKADKPKKEQKPKEQKPKAEKPKAEAAPAQAVEEKKSDPWGDCGKFALDMDSWKRFYSNNDEPVSRDYFWSDVVTAEVKENYSLWYGKYKYADELTMGFMACNLVGGMFQRLDKLRKHAFANAIIGGVNNDLNITQLWFWRGQNLAFERDVNWQTDYDIYEWRKIEWDSQEAKDLVSAYWMWDEKAKFDGKAFNNGKTYK